MITCLFVNRFRPAERFQRQEFQVGGSDSDLAAALAASLQADNYDLGNYNYNDVDKYNEVHNAIEERTNQVFIVGDWVYHKRLEEGKVVEIERGKSDTVVCVRFIKPDPERRDGEHSSFHRFAWEDQNKYLTLIENVDEDIASLGAAVILDNGLVGMIEKEFPDSGTKHTPHHHIIITCGLSENITNTTISYNCVSLFNIFYNLFECFCL